jgi:hypothetical protein
VHNKLLKSKFNHVNLVGVELEGGWDAEPQALGHDGSVDVEAEWVGEIIPPNPLKPHAILGWVEKNYPQHANETCGMHVHVSFKTMLDYARVTEKAFESYALDQIEKWGNNFTIYTGETREPKKRIIIEHPFWARLRGLNIRYCRREFIPEKQVWHKDKADIRYTQFNFVWSRYKTVECRLLPMFADARVAISAIANLLNLYEEYLRRYAVRVKREVPVKGVVLDDGKEDTLAEINDEVTLGATFAIPKKATGVDLMDETLYSIDSEVVLQETTRSHLFFNSETGEVVRI